MFIAAQPSDFNLRSLKLDEKSAESFLLWNTTQIKAKDDDLDIHFVFEYKEGDEILGYRAPRSNRFYFVQDPNGASMKQMESYHVQVKSEPSVRRHLFGGYQLM